MAAAATVAVDYSRLKLLCILEGPGAAVLSHALKFGTKKTFTITLLDHLTSLPDSSTANFRVLNSERRRKAFNSDEKRKIADDPSCESFDVTLLYKSIKLACEDVAGPNDAHWQDETVMEGLLTKIKEERNECVHERPQMADEQQLIDKVEELKSLFNRALQAVKDKYRVSDSETKDVIDNITRLTQDVLHAFTDKVILEMNFDKQLNLFKQVAVSHLKDVFNEFQYIDPLLFLSGSEEKRVNIQTVFTKLFLKQQPKDLDINCFDVLKLLTAKDQRPRLAVVSGIAGSGKTTLLTFILSEWLKEECDRRVRHLEEYDIVLRILCRDTDAEDLETFLSLVLPSSLSVFNEPHIKYLKNCRVLFLIDGLDERNSTSEKLVTNILNITKHNKEKFSILATSRPERVEQFLASTRQHYEQSHISIKGIPITRRMEFAMQYCTSKIQERLRNFIKKQSDMTLFELPLNLIFLVTLFEDRPNCITSKITQSSLYTHIHEWCTEKLHHRISVHPTWGSNEPETLKMRIKRVLKEMYQLALQSLLQDRLYLSDNDIERLVDCCKREELPVKEVLGAFFTHQSSITNRIVMQKYYTPHKGLLDYFAARHIMLRLQDVSLLPPGAIRSLPQSATKPQTQRPRLQDRLISLLGPIRSRFQFATQPQTQCPRLKDRSQSQPGTIRSLLQGADEPHIQYPHIQDGSLAGPGSSRNMLQGVAQPHTRLLHLLDLRNLFFHVAGLLATEEVPNHSETVKEVIELVGETGAKWDEWLSLVEHTDYEESFLKEIAHYVIENPLRGAVRIRDNTLRSAVALLPRIPPTTVELLLHNENVNVKIVHALTNHHCTELSLQHHYQNPGNIPASDTVLRAIKR
ncbi:hypothetical protein E2C01_037885 [Portunus trituberculatus]|uniref:NACHT domain-containing protein n=1 Tax=Portunus trituberculatus TaxID=210409 RepID=A0A5B7FH12_PORTR|nr:hypothetical protein [Portunus trituberculatus]